MSAKSMTSYAKAQGETKNVKLKIEIKTVNHRFLDLNFKIPQIYWEFENKMRSVIQEYIKRGRVDIFISREIIVGDEKKLTINRPLFESYVSLYEEVLETYTGATLSLDVIKSLLDKKDIIKIEDDEVQKEEEELLFSLLNDALKNILSMKEKEGEALLQDIEERFSKVGLLRDKIEKKVSEDKKQEYFKKLKDRLSKISKDYNITLQEDRLITEVSLIVDKLDITEELVRIKSHLNQTNDIIKEEASGRKLEFMLQELGREFNTISSKINDAEIQFICVDAKSEIEKIREQVQNIE